MVGLCVGLAGAIAAPGAMSVDAGLRVDVARVPLSPQPARFLTWRRGRGRGPGGPPGRGCSTRRREGCPAEARGARRTVESGSGAGPVRAEAVFFDAGADSPTVPVVTLADVGADQLLSAVVDALVTAGPSSTVVFDALVALGVAAQDTSAAAVVLADAVQR